MAQVDKLVSIVVPCYNHGHFLKETLDSILDSDYKDLEIIIVDDGSTDDSFVKAQEFANALTLKGVSIRAMTQTNGGPAKARNTGIRAASGKYILALDADDKISPNYLSETITALERQEDIKVVYAKAQKFGAVNKDWKLKNYSPENLAKDNMIYVSALYRKSDWHRVGGYTENPILVREDWEFWIKVLKDGGKAIQLPFVGFYYRIHSDSRRKSMNAKKKALEVAYLNKHHSAYFKKYLHGPLRNQRSLSKLINFLAKPFLQE